MSTMVPGQALYSCVTESLSAFPEDAHIKLFQFLDASGASETEKKLMQQAWTRVIMASEAFGRKKAVIDPVLFGQEFVKELGVESKELIKLEEMITTFRAIISTNENAKKKNNGAAEALNSIHDLKKTTGVLTTLQSMTKVGRDLSNAQMSIYASRAIVGVTAATGSVEAEETILAHRRSTRGAKFVFNGRKPHSASPQYSPISPEKLGSAEVLYGESVVKSSATGTRPATSPIVGVKVGSKQASHHARAWGSYQCLNEVIARGPDRLRMFPAPLAVIKHVDQPGPTFVFDLPSCQPLLPLMGPTMATFLRKHPAVVLSWCAQMGATMQSFRHLASGRLMRLPTLENVFVCENGQLLVGDSCFEEADEEELANEARGGRSESDLAPFFFELLATALGTSRGVRCALEPALTYADEDENRGGGGGEEEDEELANNNDPKRVDASREEVVAVMQGSSVDLELVGHSCRGVSVMNADYGADGDGGARPSPNKSNLQVHLFGEESVASVASLVSSGRAGSTGVRVTAKKAGHSLLRVVAGNNDRLVGAGNKNTTMAVDVRIIVVPAKPVKSVALQELLSHLQASHSTRDLDMFMSSHCIRLEDPEAISNNTHNTDPCPHQFAPDEVEAATAWTEIVHALEASMHVGKENKTR